MLAEWHAETSGATFTVYPDGCRDLVWTCLKGLAPFWRLTPLDLHARHLCPPEGTRLVGFRLAPGTVLAPDLWQALRAGVEPDAATVSALAHRPAELDEVMTAAAMAETGTVADLARSVGVSPRSLHRRVVAGTGQPPVFWLRLARLRRAMAGAKTGQAGAGLADTALEAGFADQAHFSRECRQFYGQSPARLLADPGAMAEILAPGFGDHPTWVQSSISVPSGART